MTDDIEPMDDAQKDLNFQETPDTLPESESTLSEGITVMLREWREGDADALHNVVSLLYDDFRRMARVYLKGGPRNSIAPTALVHEVYINLMGFAMPEFNDRTHFFRTACLMMRQVLVKHAQAKVAQKRGGDMNRVSLEDAMNYHGKEDLDPVTMLAIDGALKRLAEVDQRKARILELRFFVGLSLEEISEIMDLSTRSIKREWRAAKQELAYELKHNPGKAW